MSTTTLNIAAKRLSGSYRGVSLCPSFIGVDNGTWQHQPMQHSAEFGIERTEGRGKRVRVEI